MIPKSAVFVWIEDAIIVHVPSTVVGGQGHNLRIPLTERAFKQFLNLLLERVRDVGSLGNPSSPTRYQFERKTPLGRRRVIGRSSPAQREATRRILKEMGMI